MVTQISKLVLIVTRQKIYTIARLNTIWKCKKSINYNAFYLFHNSYTCLKYTIYIIECIKNIIFCNHAIYYCCYNLNISFFSFFPSVIKMKLIVLFLYQKVYIVLFSNLEFKTITVWCQKKNRYTYIYIIYIFIFISF